MMYKILYFIEIPFFKKYRRNFYYNLIEYLYKNQLHSFKKSCNLDKLLNDHLKNTFELFSIAPIEKAQKLRDFK